jgi:hypothetical protein
MILFRMIEVRAIIQHITARSLAHARSLLLDVASAMPRALLQRTVCTPTAHDKADDLPDRDSGQDATSYGLLYGCCFERISRWPTRC